MLKRNSERGHNSIHQQPFSYLTCYKIVFNNGTVNFIVVNAKQFPSKHF